MTRTARRNAVRSTIILSGFLLVSLIFFGASRYRVEAASSGPSPSHTNAPGEDNCTTCHITYPVNSGEGSVVISGLPHDYLPGQPYTITVTVSDQIAVIYGFQVTAIDPTGTKAGDFAVPLPIDNPNARTQIKHGVTNSKPRDYVEHTLHGTQPTAFGSNSWTFTWTAPTTRVGKVSFYAAGNAANSNSQPTGDYIYTTSNGALAGSATANFDGDLTSDVAYFRPSTATWYSTSLQTSQTNSIQFGSGTDRVVAGDYDGDGTTDLALYNAATSQWNVQRSTLGPLSIVWGTVGDVPVPGDYDGDGKTDEAVFRPSTGDWLLNESTAGSVTLDLGQAGDQPIQADYDGDGKTDIGIFRPSTGLWYLVRSTAGTFQLTDGTAGDQPVASDYDGDGLADIAYFRRSTASWHINYSRTQTSASISFGSPWDRPVPADYDGDGLTDLAVFSASKRSVAPAWHIRQSSTLTVFDLTAGKARDVAIASSYFPQ